MAEIVEDGNGEELASSNLGDRSPNAPRLHRPQRRSEFNSALRYIRPKRRNGRMMGAEKTLLRRRVSKTTGKRDLNR